MRGLNHVLYKFMLMLFPNRITIPTEEETLTNLPTHLIIEILSRLPAKSIARCRCVSKLWRSIFTLRSPHFTELFLTQSLTRPCLIFAAGSHGYPWIYSSLQPQISYQNLNSSLSVTAEFHISLSNSRGTQISPPGSGLIYCSYMQHNNGHEYPVLCNPSTGQILWLPRGKDTKDSVTSYFGYDSIDKQFKILSISYSLQLRNFEDSPSSFQILDLGSGRLWWKNLECPLEHSPLVGRICINGVLYYIALFRSTKTIKIYSCFDLNFEDFNFIDAPWSTEPHRLINFRGKLCGSIMDFVGYGKRHEIKLSLWVLEDVEKQEVSKHSYILPLRSQDTCYYVLGMTTTGDIVLQKLPFCVYFFILEKNALQKIEIKGLESLSLLLFVVV